MTFRIYYHKSGCIEIEADSRDEALEQFEFMDESTLDANAYVGYERDDVEEC